MNLFVCAWRPTGEPLRKSDLFGNLARMPRDLRCDSLVDGPFAAVAVAEPHAMRPLLGRYRHLIGVGDVRLDNRAELMRLAGGVCDTTSDLELVLAAIDARGTEVLARIIGDFSLVVFDARAQKLIAARDAFGVKPLYLRTADGLVVAGPRPGILGSTKYNQDFLAHFLVGQAGHEGDTVWTGVTALQPGTIRQQRGTVPTTQRFWDAATFLPSDSGNEGDQIAEFRDLFTSAVNMRLDDRSVTWAQLSGGLDSSSVVSVAEQSARDGKSRLAGTVTLVDQLGDADERQFSDLVVQRYGLRNEQITGFWPWQHEDSGPPATDEPTPLYPFYSRDLRLCDAVRSAGGRVMLSGYGSDHYLFGNFGYIPDLVMAGRLVRAMRELAGWSMASRQSLWYSARQHVVKPLLQRRANAAGSMGPAFPHWLGDPGQAGIYERLQGPISAPVARGQMFAAYTARTVSNAHAWIDRGTYQDRLEMRYPFLHRPLVEFSLRLPVHMRIRPFGRKWILREAMRGVLPEPIRQRQGKGGMDARIIWALHQEKQRIDQLLREPLLGELGLVDPAALRRAVEETRCGVGHNMVLLMSALSLETWLAAREGRLATWKKAA